MNTDSSRQSKRDEAVEPIFIVGVGRSGTTLTRLMLNSHPNISIPYESHFITKYTEGYDCSGELTTPEIREQLIDSLLNEPMLSKWNHEWNRLQLLEAAEDEPSLSGIVASFYKQYASAKGKTRWGDKSDYLDRLPKINQLFPTAKYIHVIRDGRDVASSVLKLDWGPRDIIAAASWWNDHVWLGRRLGEWMGPEQYLEVKFEDLVLDTESQLRRICDFVCEDFSSEMLEYYRTQNNEIPHDRTGLHYNTDQPPKTSRTFAWKTEMSKADAAIFQRYGGRMLMECGYATSTSKVSKIRLASRIAHVVYQKFVRSIPS